MRLRRIFHRTSAKFIPASFLLLLFTAAAFADTDSTRVSPLMNYQDETDYMPQTPSVTGGAVGALGNPASWATAGRPEWAFWWDDRHLRADRLNDWGLSFGKNLGFAYNQRTFADSSHTSTVRDYQIGFAGGDRSHHFGMAWRIPQGEIGGVPREHALSVGIIERPGRWVSFGLSGLFSMRSHARLGVADLGVRPLGRPWVTLFGDYSLRTDQAVGDGLWGAGVEVRPWNGIHLGVKARKIEGTNDLRTTLNFGLTFDEQGTHVLPGLDKNGDLEKTTFLVRENVPYRGIPMHRIEAKIAKAHIYVPVNLEHKMLTYQKDKWFDEERVAWIDLARQLETWKSDPSVAGIAVNLCDTEAPASIAWEFRGKLQEFRAAGKEVLVQVDRPSLTMYYVASVADRLTIDPQGDLTLAGLAAHRTYMRDFFEKVGIGVEEWRFFTYKSAFEAYARREMSKPDQEQRGRMIDVIYETVREGVCAGRKITPEEFDAVIENDLYLTPDIVVERKLADATARWHDLGEWLEKERNGADLRAPRPEPPQSAFPDEVWGRPKTIAIVYTLGECAMDSGIRGRATSEYMRGLAKNGQVAGVVLRADSPGGDPLPSDLVAEATRKIKEAKKPVVVTQGNVAASGGYWISMDGSKILTTPLTVTGSIGVIGGWLWNQGFSDKYGFRADGVQRGSHADLLAGIRVPVLGDLFGALPERNLDEKEHAIAKGRILAMYDDFVKGVAEGRKLPEARVREIAEGRVWMGGDAIDRGLADGFGGLLDAIDQAKAMAGLKPGDEVILTEYPPRRAFSFPRIGPSIPGLNLLLRSKDLGVAAAPDDDGVLDYWHTIAASKGGPVLRIPPEDLPPGWFVGR